MVNCPLVGQTLGFSCGPASLRSALLYWGIDVSETRLIRECVDDPKFGAQCDRMIEVAQSYLPHSYGRRRLGVRGLLRALEGGHPVIVLYQEDTGHGHYAVACHCDENVTLMNPQGGGRWDQIRLESFLQRWTDAESPQSYVRWGLVVR